MTCPVLEGMPQQVHFAALYREKALHAIAKTHCERPIKMIFIAQIGHGLKKPFMNVYNK